MDADHPSDGVLIAGRSTVQAAPVDPGTEAAVAGDATGEDEAGDLAGDPRSGGVPAEDMAGSAPAGDLTGSDPAGDDEAESSAAEFDAAAAELPLPFSGLSADDTRRIERLAAARHLDPEGGGKVAAAIAARDRSLLPAWTSVSGPDEVASIARGRAAAGRLGLDAYETEDGVFLLPSPGGAARRAGLEGGHVLESVGGIAVDGLVSAAVALSAELDAAYAERREVRLVARGLVDSARRAFEILLDDRAPEARPSVLTGLLPSGGLLIEIRSFLSGETYEDVTAALASHTPNWVTLDLRGSSGGTVAAAATVLSALAGQDR